MRSFLTLWLVLLSAVAGATEPARYDVVVVGGGPAGLAAAIEARLAGAPRVLVLEKRDSVRSRVQSLNLRSRTLDNLARLGVPLDASGGLRILERRVLLDDVAGTANVRRIRAPEVDARRATHTVKDMTRGGGGPAAVIGINDLEHALIDSAAGHGVELRFEDEVRDVVAAPGGHLVRTQRDDVHGALVFVADGSGSEIAAKLGIREIRYPGKTTRIIGGIFQQPGVGEAISRRIHGASVSSTTVAKLGGKEAAVLAEVPPDVHFADDAARHAWFLRSALLVGVSGPLTLQPNEFEVALTTVDRARWGDNLFFIGDAARTTHVLTGLGVNFALRDATRVGRLVTRLRDAKSERERRQAKRWFAEQTMRSTMHLHRRAWHLFDNLLPKPPVRRPPPSVKQLAQLGGRAR